MTCHGLMLLSENPTGPLFPLPLNPQTGDDGSHLPRVLIVDDDALIADTLVEILNGHGFIAEPAYGGSEAIDIARRNCPDIVVSDVLMPGTNGVEAAIAIQGHCPETRIILFSGQAATVELLADARAHGYTFDLLPKPLHPLKLIETLRR